MLAYSVVYRDRGSYVVILELRKSQWLCTKFALEPSKLPDKAAGRDGTRFCATLMDDEVALTVCSELVK